MQDNTTTYRVTIDIKTTRYSDLKKWITQSIQEQLNTEDGEEFVDIYMDEMRG